MRIKELVSQLNQRGVFKVVSVYVVASWGAITGAVQLVPIVGAPTWTVEAVALLALAGLPIALVVAWMFDATADGLVRTRPNELAAAQAATALSGMHGVVRVKWRDVHGIEHERILDRPFSIGREPSCAIRFDDPVVSRRHVQFGLSAGSWYVADLGSRNGTLLDGREIEREPLPKHCTVQLSERGPKLDVEVRATAAPTTVLAPNVVDR